MDSEQGVQHCQNDSLHWQAEILNLHKLGMLFGQHRSDFICKLQDTKDYKSTEIQFPLNEKAYEPESKPEGQAGIQMQLDIFPVQAILLQNHNLPVMNLEPSFPSLGELDQLLPATQNVIKSTQGIIT